MNRQEKAEFVQSFSEKIKDCEALYLADYCGLNVEKLSTLRRELREKDGELNVVKNKLAQKAIADTPFESLSEYFTNPNAVIISKSDPAAVAKVLVDFNKKNDEFELKNGWLSGEVLDLEGIKKVSNLPTREELLVTVLRSLTGPHYGLVNTMIGVHRKLIMALNAIKEKKEQ